MGYVDLHCHWLWQIDDGARSEEEGFEMLRRLRALGFEHVAATPHMRPGMFNNDAADLRAAYERCCAALVDRPDTPHTSLGCEHFFDSEVVIRVRQGAGLPYREAEVEKGGLRRGGAILIEFGDLAPLTVIERQLFELQAEGFLPVLAHPERYRAVWEKPETLLRLIELGSVALLDVSALVGKYGRHAQTSAEHLMREGAYDAACTDSHRPEDVDVAARAMDLLKSEYGPDELQYLFETAPRALLAGKRPPS